MYHCTHQQLAVLYLGKERTVSHQQSATNSPFPFLDRAFDLLEDEVVEEVIPCRVDNPVDIVRDEAQ